MKNLFRAKIFFLFLFIILNFNFTLAIACTDLKLASNKNIIIGHNVDWANKHAFIIINPIGMKRTARALPNEFIPLQWTSKYGSVTFNLAKDIHNPIFPAVITGMNQEGLTASVLSLKDSHYSPVPNNKEVLSTGQWAQYFLDTVKNVDEGIKLAKKLNIVPSEFQNKKVLVHLILHDPTGNSAVFEYKSGKLMIYQGNNFPIPVLTNNFFDDSIINLKQYKKFGGTKDLPSGYFTKTRFVLGANLLKLAPNNFTTKQGIAWMFNALGYLIEIPGSDEPTQWSVVYDLSNKTIYYRDIDNQQIRIISLSEINFNSKNFKTLILNNNYAGNIQKQFSVFIDKYNIEPKNK